MLKNRLLVLLLVSLGFGFIGLTGYTCKGASLKSCEVEVSPKQGFRWTITQQDLESGDKAK